MYKRKGSKEEYETPFDLMSKEDILKPDGSFEEFEENDNYISFYDFIKTANVILCERRELKSEEKTKTDSFDSTGNSAQNASSGDHARNASSGYNAQNASSGDHAQNASSGNHAQNASSGYNAQNASSGDHAQNASSGDRARNKITGKNSVCFDCGFKGIVKAINGTWIALQSYKKDGDNYIPDYAKTAQIGNPEFTDFHGKALGEKYSYTLIGKDLWPCDYIDGDLMLFTQEKELGEYSVYRAYYESDYRERGADAEKVFIASNGEFNAHGETLKEAISDLQFKIAQSKDVSEHIERVKRENKLTPLDYRLITGACKSGTQRFLNEMSKTWEDSATIDEVIELTKGYWGHEILVRLLKEEKANV